MTKPYIDFYKQHNISPVSQNIDDIQKHFERRAAMYRHMGIVPSSLKDRRVIEFGPGSGFNSLHTNSLKPSLYLLVDGNPTGAQKTSELLNKYYPDSVNYNVIESLIEEYKTNELFDFVICEGVIPNQNNPSTFLKHVASFVDLGGVLMISCADSVSTLADNIRRVLADIKVPSNLPLKERISKLCLYYSVDIKNLKGMSRPAEDWVLDNIIQPISSHGPLLSIADAIEAISETFEIHGTSPKFFIDWRWYKDIYNTESKYNEIGINNYKSNIHNLLDYRYFARPLDFQLNIEILQAADKIRAHCQDYELDPKVEILFSICYNLLIIKEIIVDLLPETATCLEEVSYSIDCYAKGGGLQDLKLFPHLFGRGQQYVSFIRKDNV
ncbi:MAG: methyltransferase domain-containing protein [Chlorobium sp.]|jgi:hypothetical protein|nr:methyltransferase domain-containing protein [Chlorobium sp.]